MRVTSSSYTNFQLQALQKNSEKVAQQQQKLATGKNFVRISDDPQAVRESLRLQGEIANERSFVQNGERAVDFLANGETALRDASSLLTEARTLALSTATPVFNESDREAVAQEIDQILEQMVDLGNTQVADRFLFSGTETATKPFNVQRDVDGNIVQVNYQGNSEEQQIFLGDADKVAINVSGDRAFASSFAELIELRDTLRNDAGVSEQQQIADISAQIGFLDDSSENILDAVTQLGSRIKRVEYTQDRHLERELQLEVRRSQVEDVDIAQTAVELHRAENGLQATIFTIARGTPSLLDVLS